MSPLPGQGGEARREVLHNHGYAALATGWRSGERPARQGSHRVLTLAVYRFSSQLMNLRQALGVVAADASSAGSPARWAK